MVVHVDPIYDNRVGLWFAVWQVTIVCPFYCIPIYAVQKKNIFQRLSSRPKSGRQKKKKFFLSYLLSRGNIKSGCNKLREKVLNYEFQPLGFMNSFGKQENLNYFTRTRLIRQTHIPVQNKKEEPYVFFFLSESNSVI